MSRTNDILKLVRKHKHKSAAAAPAVDDDNTADSDEPHVPVGVRGIIAATSKLLAVNRGLAEPDERDSWEFKRVMTPDRLMQERIRMDASKTRRKLSRMVARRGNLGALLPFAFDDDVQGLIIGNALSSPLEEINPLHIHEQSRRVTLMGPGGIGSANAVTEDMQNIHGSQFGFIDPLAGPESERAGIDTRLANGVKIGSDGRLYQRFRSPKDGKRHWLSPDGLRGRTVALPP